MPSVRILTPATTVSSSISIAFGTYTGISASVLTVQIIADDGSSIVTADSTSTVSLTQNGIGSLLIGATTLTVSSGVKTTTYRGKSAGPVAILGASTNKNTGVATLEITYNPQLYANGRLGTTSAGGGGGGAGANLLRNTIKINNATLYRIVLWDLNQVSNDRGDIAAIIHDAKNVGVSSYLNEGGEMFFTLPYNHPQISECVPLERHYRVDRFDEEAGRYVTVGQGILEDYEATENETVFYGIDYMKVLEKTITTATTTSTITYNDQTFETIYQSEMTQARSQSYSRLGFIDYTLYTGTPFTWNWTSSKPLVINSTTTTYDIFTAGESRGSFLTNLANIAMEGTTTKVAFGNTLESDTELYNGFFCDMNWSPTPNNDVVLEYGGNVKSFSYSPNFKALLTKSLVIATSIANGVSPTKIWSSVATISTAPVSTYGVIEAAFIEEDLSSQAAADKKARYRLYQSTPEKIKNISIAIKDGSIIPFKRYKLGDDIRVIIQRGNVNIDTNLTLRGQRYFAATDGTEELWFDFFPRDTMTDAQIANSNAKGKKEKVPVPGKKNRDK
jgi:hypothetical protein